MYKKFEQETAMGDNIFLKEMKEIQFEDYLNMMPNAEEIWEMSFR